jgi:flagellar protein FliL
VTFGLNEGVTKQELIVVEAIESDAAPSAKRSRKPLVIGALLALLSGGGGFYAVFSGMILGSEHSAAESMHPEVKALPEVTFVPIDSVILALGSGSQNRHLKFTAQVEVDSAYAADVALLTPRILDVFNSYLSAVDPLMLEQSAAIVRVRAQLLRRVQMVVGEGRARDLLITEFVLN